WSARSWADVLHHLDQREGEVTELTLGFRTPREVLDYAARLLPAIAPGLAVPRSLRPGPGSLTVRRVDDLTPAVVEAVRAALAREGSIGVIVADARVAATSAALTEFAGVDHAVLSLEGATECRLQVVPATLAKGLEYDHVIVAEPS